MLPHPSRWRSESDESGSVHFINLKRFPFALCTSSYWFRQHSFTNLIMTCCIVIAYKSREVLKRDGVTLLCWWGNIHKFCISDEVTSYLQFIYFTIPVIIRAWILLQNSCFTISMVYRYINIDGEIFLFLVSTDCKNCGKTRQLRSAVTHILLSWHINIHQR